MDGVMIAVAPQLARGAGHQRRNARGDECSGAGGGTKRDISEPLMNQLILALNYTDDEDLSLRQWQTDFDDE